MREQDDYISDAMEKILIFMDLEETVHRLELGSTEGEAEGNFGYSFILQYSTEALERHRDHLGHERRECREMLGQNRCVRNT